MGKSYHSYTVSCSGTWSAVLVKKLNYKTFLLLGMIYWLIRVVTNLFIFCLSSCWGFRNPNTSPCFPHLISLYLFKLFKKLVGPKGRCITLFWMNFSCPEWMNGPWKKDEKGLLEGFMTNKTSEPCWPRPQGNTYEPFLLHLICPSWMHCLWLCGANMVI